MVGLRKLGAALLVITTSGCGNVKLRPPPAPPATMPDVAERPPPPEGESRIIVSTDVPARVSIASTGSYYNRGPRLRYSERYYSADKVLCQVTPCSVRVPRGDYLLLFQAVDDGDRWSTMNLVAKEPTEVVNHTLGRHGASIAKPIGVAAMLTGAALLGMSLFMTRGKAANLSTQTQVIGLAGSAGIAFGGVLYFASPTYHQEGSTTQWTPATPTGPIGRTYSSGVGLRF